MGVIREKEFVVRVTNELQTRFSTLLKDLYGIDTGKMSDDDVFTTIIMSSLKVFLDISYAHSQGSVIVIHPTDGEPYQWKAELQKN